MAAQMIESVQMSVQMSVRCTSKEIGLDMEQIKRAMKKPCSKAKE